MDAKTLRQHLLGGKKTERIIFAVTPEMKEALSVVSADRCTSVSGLITSAVIEEIIKCGDLFDEGALRQSPISE